MKTLFLTTVAICGFNVATQAQIKNATTETVKVYGNCGMCESTIERAADKKNIAKADWNQATTMATITYDSKKTSIDEVLKNIALAGYDNEKFLAPDETYNKLPGCCKYERERKMTAKNNVSGDEKKHDGHEGHNHGEMKDQHGNNPKSGSLQSEKKLPVNAGMQQDSSQLLLVFNQYYSIKDALVKSDALGAAVQASSLFSTLAAVKMGALSEEEHKTWMDEEKKLKSHAQAIGQTKDAATQREHFSNLSNAMYALLKSSKPLAAVYWQHCPMYNDNKGANWLSKESAIRNPYYGSMMLTCGKTVETIQ